MPDRYIVRTFRCEETERWGVIVATEEHTSRATAVPRRDALREEERLRQEKEKSLHTFIFDILHMREWHPQRLPSRIHSSPQAIRARQWAAEAMRKYEEDRSGRNA